MPINDIKKVYLPILITAFSWASMEVALKLVGSSMDPFQLTFVRFAVGGLLLLPFAIVEIKKHNLKLKIKDLLYLALLGTLCIPISMVLFQLGVIHSNASTAAVILSINPLFSIVFAYFIIGEKITKNKIIFLMFGFSGIFFIMRPWELQQGNSFTGLFLVLAGAMAFSLYTVMGKVSVEKIGIMPQTAISFLLGAFVLFVIVIATGKPVFHGIIENFALVFYVSVVVSGIAYYTYFLAIKNSDVATGSYVFFIKPVLAPVIAVIVLGESILWNTYVGIALILTATYLNIKGKRDENRRH